MEQLIPAAYFPPEFPQACWDRWLRQSVAEGYCSPCGNREKFSPIDWIRSMAWQLSIPQDEVRGLADYNDDKHLDSAPKESGWLRGRLGERRED